VTHPRVGWIGLGRLGRPMAARVAAAGWPLAVWARQPEAAAAWRAGLPAPLRDSVAVCATPAALAAQADIVGTVVAGPEDVAALHEQLMPAARPGTLFIEMSTVAPRNGVEAQARATRHGLMSVEAPLTGGVAGAERGTLTAFVAGEPGAVARAEPLLRLFCQRLVPCGAAGQGYRHKLVNQTLVAGTVLALADGARMARAAGIAPEGVKAALASGTAASAQLEAYWGRMAGLDGPVTFTLGLLHKDVVLARDEARALGLQAPLLDAAVAVLAQAIATHGAGAGVQRLAA
jgi:3-hydroxyisobutyrate dehydrogenase-like beta-hydroxyacid dehydrogenase